jgi:hypothetical protein
MNARLSLVTICGAIAALVVPTFAHASSISIEAGDPQLSGMVSAVWRSPTGQVIHDSEMPADGTMTSSDMAARTKQHLLGIPGVDPASVSATGNQVNIHSTPQLDPLDGVLPGGSIYWGTGTTAQASMKLSSPDASHATVAATGHFQPFYQQQPAIFTAGIVTDLGTLSSSVSAQELNFQTDGPIICQALFQRLAPRAPQYGAQINYAGDRLEIYFDPAYTVTQGGIIFGTTSPSQGYSGTLITPPEPLPGDINGDGVFDALDYPVWRKGLGTIYTPNDFDIWRAHFGEGLSFWSASGLGGTSAVPEPGPGILVVIGLSTMLIRGRLLIPKPIKARFVPASHLF